MNFYKYFWSIPGTAFSSCWPTSDTVFDKIVHSTADVFNAASTAACFLGGAGLTLANAWDETLKTSFYGSVATTGQINASFNLRSFDYIINQTIPASFEKNLHDADYYHLHDYLEPNKLRMISGVVTLVGATFKLISDNVTHWQQERRDTERFKFKHKVDLPQATKKEYLYLSGASLSRSVMYTSLGSTAAGAFINYSGVVGSLIQSTFPTLGTETVNTSRYKGPVRSTIIPVDYNFYKRLTFDLYGQELIIDENITIQAEADVKYGGGLFFQSNAEPDFPIAAPIVTSILSYYTGTFFANKAKNLRDERLLEANNGAIALEI